MTFQYTGLGLGRDILLYSLVFPAFDEAEGTRNDEFDSNTTDEQ